MHAAVFFSPRNEASGRMQDCSCTGRPGRCHTPVEFVLGCAWLCCWMPMVNRSDQESVGCRSFGCFTAHCMRTGGTAVKGTQDHDCSMTSLLCTFGVSEDVEKRSHLTHLFPPLVRILKSFKLPRATDDICFRACLS